MEETFSEDFVFSRPRQSLPDNQSPSKTAYFLATLGLAGTRLRLAPTSTVFAKSPWDTETFFGGNYPLLLDQYLGWEGKTVESLFGHILKQERSVFERGKIFEEQRATGCYKALRKLSTELMRVESGQERTLIDPIVWRFGFPETYSRLWGSLQTSPKDSSEAIFIPYLWDPNHTIWGMRPKDNLCQATCPAKAILSSRQRTQCAIKTDWEPKWAVNIWNTIPLLRAQQNR